jgi:DNA-binding winged helix-turn-helix (wHTH) protein/Tfp pilus assembly protein PilF
MDQDFRLGSWVVRPSLNSIALGDKTSRLEPKAMELLVYLAGHAGTVVAKEQLISAIWANTFVTDDVLIRCVSELRKAFGDDAKAPRMIETIPKRGYRLLKRVEPVQPRTRNWFGPAVSGLQQVWVSRKRRMVLLLFAFTSLALILVLVGALPWMARFCNNRGVQLQQGGRLKDAIQYYQRALSLNSAYAEAHYNLADAYEEIPDYEKALEEYQRAIDIDLAFYPAYNNLSRLYILRGNYGPALNLLDRALSLKPKETSVQYSLFKNYGWANFGLHNLGQAEQNLRSAVELYPDRGAAHCLLAKVLAAQERATSAVGEWETCVAYSNQDVEPEWLNEAKESLGKEIIK